MGSDAGLISWAWGLCKHRPGHRTGPPYGECPQSLALPSCPFSLDCLFSNLLDWLSNCPFIFSMVEHCQTGEALTGGNGVVDWCSAGHWSSTKHKKKVKGPWVSKYCTIVLTWPVTGPIGQSKISDIHQMLQTPIIKLQFICELFTMCNHNRHWPPYSTSSCMFAGHVL